MIDTRAWYNCWFPESVHFWLTIWVPLNKHSFREISNWNCFFIGDLWYFSFTYILHMSFLLCSYFLSSYFIHPTSFQVIRWSQGRSFCHVYDLLQILTLDLARFLMRWCRKRFVLATTGWHTPEFGKPALESKQIWADVHEVSRNIYFSHPRSI